MMHHSFVVRICALPQGRWHGQVVYVGTEQVKQFLSLDAMTEFIGKCLCLALLEPPDILESDFHERTFPTFSSHDELN